MFYDKKYVISDYLNHEELNELINKEKELIDEMAFKKVKDDEYVYVNGEQKEADSDYSLLGNTTQNGTPTPSSPIPVETVSGRQEIEVCGKNLFKVHEGNTVTSVNVQFTRNDDGTITLNGTANNNGYVEILYAFQNGTSQQNTPTLFLDSSSQYSISFVNISGTTTSTDTRFVYQYNSTGSQTTIYPNNSQSISNCDGLYRAYFRIPNGATFNNYTLGIQLERGNQSTTFEKYIGNTYEINLGKQLFDINGTTTTGTLEQYNNGFILTKGTNRVIRFVLPQILEKGTYTLSYDVVNLDKTLTNYFFVNVQYGNENTTVLQNVILNDTGATFTTTSQFDRLYFFMSGSEASSSTITIDNIQLEKGSQASSFSSYKTPIELCKIGDYKDFIRKGTGKNLLQLTDGTYSNNGITAVVNNGIIVLNGTASANSFITIPSNVDSIYSSLSGSYTLCSNNKQTVGSTTTSGTYADVRIMGNNGVSFIWRNILGNQNASQTSTSSTYTNISLQIRTGSGLSYSNFVIEPQLEKGNQVTEYEPYGYKDKWYLYKTIGKIILNGSETWVSWNSQSSGNTRLFGTNIIDNVLKIGYVGLSNYFANSSSTIWSTDTEALQVSASGENQIRLRLSRTIADGTTAFKTWLSTNNTSVYYVLVTPITTEITDTELINQLESVWKSIKYWNYIEILPSENYDLDLPVYSLNDFVFLEDIDKIEKNIMQIGYDFFQPMGYIQNKIWVKNISVLGYENISNNFGSEDLNRMITDMNILYEHKDDTPTIYNLYANENWNEETSLEWE